MDRKSLLFGLLGFYLLWEDFMGRKGGGKAPVVAVARIDRKAEKIFWSKGKREMIR
jgi:hypothetical protein